MAISEHLSSPPYPWFGGKSAVAAEVWARFGDCPNYVEPFFGGGAVWRLRPHYPFDSSLFIRRETINDYDGHVSNFWRAVQHDPDGVVDNMADPPMELDLHARGAVLFLRSNDFIEQMREDPDLYDVKLAGWWCWFVSNWIGGLPQLDEDKDSIKRQRPHLSDAGQGVSRRIPHLGRAGTGVSRKLPHLGRAGKGVSRRLPHLGRAGAFEQKKNNLREWMYALRDRLAYVRVCCGDWTRVTGKAVTWNNSTPCAVFLDPPYSAEAGRNNDLYSCEDASIAHNVREWARVEAKIPGMRIALCGYRGEGHESLLEDGWTEYAWKAAGGYTRLGIGPNKDNNEKEVIYFSPQCLKPEKGQQCSLFE